MHYLQAFCLLLAYARAQETTTVPPTWNGDPKICTVDTSPPTTDPPYPVFPTKAEFALESVQINHISDLTLLSTVNIFQYIYDYDANKVIRIKKSNGIVAAEYYYYEILKVSTYFQNNFCVVSGIATNIDSGMFDRNRVWATW
jgi:hypothetical protein